MVPRVVRALLCTAASIAAPTWGGMLLLGAAEPPIWP